MDGGACWFLHPLCNMSIRSINPANNQLLKEYQPHTREQILDAVGRAHGAFGKWRETSFGIRKEALLKFAGLLRSRTDEYAKLITLEMGKRIKESRSEIEYCARIAEFYANGAEEFLSDRPMDARDANAYVQHTPIGALFGVMPWNFPFYQVTRFAAPNIMAGNTVLVKHAGCVPQCAEAIEGLFTECGLPEGVYANLFIPSELSPIVIGHSHIAGVSLTGSESAGASVASEAGKNLKRSVLELGGNDAFIVLADADLESTIPKAIKGRMVNAGQSCVAAKRFIVVEPLYEKFLAGMKKGMSKMKMGDPMDEATDLGPLSSESAAERLEKQVRDTVDAGAKVVLGGKRADREGAYFEPTILTGVTPDMPSFDQELFGPVATIYRVAGEDEAIALANNSSYGLGGSIHSQDEERARKLAGRIDTGMVFINQSTNSQEDLPFGGTKNSGYGRELSEYGIKEFVNVKLIHRMA
jgi:succinate-semialdehyde dehydrogenase/glutarate-semialdehyde dehydrogenase